MNHSTSRCNYLLVCIILLVVARAILFMFLLALDLPYTERPLRKFPFTTPTAAPADFTRLPSISHQSANAELNIVIKDQHG